MATKKAPAKAGMMKCGAGSGAGRMEKAGMPVKTPSKTKKDK